ncbi:hypothetical protein GOBAR_DD19155 [Gossypium barbadense]|nr:hypothetical protein GOBAR_DD19155 [Gossypium barbadense]
MVQGPETSYGFCCKGIRDEFVEYYSAAHNRTSAIPNDKTGIAVVEGCFKRSIEVHLDKRFLRGLPYWSNCFHLGMYFISQLLHLPYNAEDNRAYILDWLSFSFHYALVSGLPECPSHDCSNLTKIMPLFRKTTLSQGHTSESVVDVRFDKTALEFPLPPFHVKGSRPGDKPIGDEFVEYYSAAHNRASTIPNEKTGIGVVAGFFTRNIEVHLNKRFLMGLPYWSHCFHLGRYFISQLSHLPYNAEDNRAYIFDWLSFSFHYALVSGLPECSSHGCSNLTTIMPLF